MSLPPPWTGSVAPMLARKYQRRYTRFDEGAWLQPKLDGIRCVARRTANGVQLWSRSGKEFRGLDHIRQALLGIMQPGEHWDGELYRHGTTFQRLQSWVTRGQTDARVEFHVFDAMQCQPFNRRHAHIARSIPAGGPIKLVNMVAVTSHEDVATRQARYVQAGFEGAILRTSDEPYRNCQNEERVPFMVKVKAFKDGEFKIVDVAPSPAGFAKFICETKEGATFDAFPEGKNHLRRQYLAERGLLVGHMLTVRFFEWTTSEFPVPRHAVAVSVRDYE